METYRNYVTLFQSQTSALRPPVVLEIKIPQELHIVFLCVDLKQSRRIGFVVDEAEKVSQRMSSLEIEQDGVDYEETESVQKSALSSRNQDTRFDVPRSGSPLSTALIKARLSCFMLMSKGTCLEDFGS